MIESDRLTKYMSLLASALFVLLITYSKKYLIRLPADNMIKQEI